MYGIVMDRLYCIVSLIPNVRRYSRVCTPVHSNIPDRHATKDS